MRRLAGLLSNPSWEGGAALPTTYSPHTTICQPPQTRNGQDGQEIASKWSENGQEMVMKSSKNVRKWSEGVRKWFKMVLVRKLSGNVQEMSGKVL